MRSIKIIEKGQLDKISDLEVRYKNTDDRQDLSGTRRPSAAGKKELSVQNVKLSEPVGAEDDKVVDTYLKARELQLVQHSVIS